MNSIQSAALTARGVITVLAGVWLFASIGAAIVGAQSFVGMHGEVAAGSASAFINYHGSARATA